MDVSTLERPPEAWATENGKWSIERVGVDVVRVTNLRTGIITTVTLDRTRGFQYSGVGALPAYIRVVARKMLLRQA